MTAPAQDSGDNESVRTFAPLVERGLAAPGTRLTGFGRPEYAAMQDGQVVNVIYWMLDGAGGHTFRGLEGPFQGGYDNPTLEPGGGGGGYEIPAPVPNDTPCVNENARPSGASMHDINTAALAAANAIEAKGGYDDQQRDSDLNWGEERVEWGSFVFVLNGVVGYTTPYTHNIEDQIPIYPNDLNVVPNGATIVGFVHNHTALGQNSSQDQRRISLDDLAILPQLHSYVNANGLGRGVSVDANMLMYIHAPEAVGPQDANRTRVYDKFDDENYLECALQGPSA